MDRQVPEQPGPWTEADYLGLRRADPPAGRVELVDGALVVGPGVTPGRDRVVERVREAVAAALPEGLRVVGPVPLRLGRDCVLLPDLVVARAAEPDPSGPDAGATPDPAAPQDTADPEEGPAAVPPAPDDDAVLDDAVLDDAVLDAADALMVLEVVGDEHGALDRSFKPQLYARSRIPYSLVVDHDAGFSAATMIISGRYHEYAYAAAGEVLRIEEPFVLTLDVDSDVDAAQEQTRAG